MTLLFRYHASSYDIFAISIAVTMLGFVYGTTTDPQNLRMLSSLAFLIILRSRLAALLPWQTVGLKVATPAGNLIGQLLFGWLADIVGRKRMCE